MPFRALAALFSGTSPSGLVKAAKAGDLARVDKLLDAGVPIDSLADGAFPLFAAAFYGHLELVKHLRQRGASLETQVSADATTALQALAQLDVSPQICEALLEAATSVDRVGPPGLTPLMLACQFNRRAMVEALLAHGANVNATITQPCPVDPLPGDLLGFTPLTFALHNGNDTLVDPLLRAGATLGSKLAHGVTELALAASAAGPVAIERLVEAGADPSQAIASGTLAGLTPLMMACTLPDSLSRSGNAVEVAGFIANRINVVRALLDAGADASAVDHHGKRGRDYAAQSGLLKVAPDLFTA